MATAEAATITWLAISRTGAGFSPGNPNESAVTIGSPERSSGERRYVNVTFASNITATNANLLVLPTGLGCELVAASAGSAYADTSRGEEWTAGLFPNNTFGERPLTIPFTATRDTPIFLTHSDATWTIRGDFVVHAWGANVTASSKSPAVDVYRSGGWWDNATGSQIHPRGLTRTDHWQLLRITFSNATFHLHHQTGLAQWAAEEASSETTGIVTLAGATGTLTTGNGAYAPSDADVGLTGTVSLLVRSSDQDRETMRGQVQGLVTRVDGVPHTASRKIATSGDSWQVTLPILALLALLGLGAASVTRRRRRLEPGGELVERAQGALAGRRPRRALRLASRLLKQSPDDPEAWFVYGASLQAQHAHDRVVTEIGPVAERLGRPPSLAFIIGLSGFLLHRMDVAEPWLRAASQDPEFLRHIRESPLFEPIRTSGALQRWLAAEPNVAYG